MCLLHSLSQQVSSWLRSKTSRKEHDVKGVVSGKNIFKLCHMRQVILRWPLGSLLLAHAGLRAEDSQRLKVGSYGCTDVCDSRNFAGILSLEVFSNMPLGRTPLWCSGGRRQG